MGILQNFVQIDKLNIYIYVLYIYDDDTYDDDDDDDMDDDDDYYYYY